MFQFITRLFAAPVASKPVPRARLRLESLEERSVPAFLAPVTSAAPAGTVAVCAGDFNHDGRDDIASINGTFDSSPYGVLAGNEISIRLSNGDGTFRSAGTLSRSKGGDYLVGFEAQGNSLVATVMDKNPKHIVPADGSWEYDIYSIHIYTWRGNGDGTFGRASSQTQKVKGGIGPILIQGKFARADYNRDGLTDSVKIDSSTSSAALYLQMLDNPGHYHEPVYYPAGPRPNLVCAGDFNGDGWVDFIELSSQTPTSPTLSVSLNDGNW